MKVTYAISFALTFLLSVSGCIMHSDPLKNWKLLHAFSSKDVPDIVKRDARAYILTLPISERNSVLDDDAITYWEDGTGQHAVQLQTPHDGERWYYALIYDEQNRRIKVLKFSKGIYLS